MSEVFSLGYVFKKCALNKATEELELVAYSFFFLVLLNLSVLVYLTAAY